MTPATATDRDAVLLLSVLLGDGERPLTLREWGTVVSAMQRTRASSPAGLLGQSAADITRVLGLEVAFGEHVARLLDRGALLAVELERLENRGIWLLTCVEDKYPSRLTKRLGLKAPPVLFGSGDRSLVNEGGVAIVGSRDASEAAAAFAHELASSAARTGTCVVSGAARGIDRTAMGSALSTGGTAVGVLAESLVKGARSADARAALADGLLVLLTPYGANARFSVGAAMGRNKLIYCLADAAVVVATTQGTGGTWAGATEALKAGWTPVWAWTGEGAPGNNEALLDLGACPLPLAPDTPSELLKDGLASRPEETSQATLFD